MNTEIFSHPAVQVYLGGVDISSDPIMLEDEELNDILPRLAQLDPSREYGMYDYETGEHDPTPEFEAAAEAAIVQDKFEKNGDCYWDGQKLLFRDGRIGYDLSVGGSPASSSMSVYIVSKT